MSIYDSYNKIKHKLIEIDYIIDDICIEKDIKYPPEKFSKNKNNKEICDISIKLSELENLVIKAMKNNRE